MVSGSRPTPGTVGTGVLGGSESGDVASLAPHAPSRKASAITDRRSMRPLNRVRALKSRRVRTTTALLHERDKGDGPHRHPRQRNPAQVIDPISYCWRAVGRESR